MNEVRKQDAFSGCHPIINFFYFLIVLGYTMFMQHPVFLLISFAGATAYGIWLKGWKQVIKMNFLLTFPALLIVALVNPLFNHYGVTNIAYIEYTGNYVTLEALVYGLVLGCVLFIVIEWFTCYNVVMTSDKFIYIFGKVIPALSLMLSMALRFVPRFGKQLEVIRNGQKCAGHDISNSGLLNKARYGMAMLSILVTWALENAIETADSMKSRGYGLKGRTAYSNYRFDSRDMKAGLALLVLFVIFASGCMKGAAYASFNPRIMLAGFVIGGYEAPVSCNHFLALASYVSYGLFCFLPVIMGLKEELVLERARKHVGASMEMTYRRIYEEIDREGANI